MKEIAAALLAVQAESPRIQKSAVNPHFNSKFVPMDVLLDEVLPILNKHGIVVLQPPSVLESGMPALKTILIHAETGQSIEETMPLAVEKPTPQGQASATTYARRNALMSMLGLAGHDDDGEAAEPKQGEKPSAAQHRKLEALFKELDERFPKAEGEPTWQQDTQLYMESSFNKRSRAHLTKSEMSQVIDTVQGWLDTEDIPFG